MNRWPRSAGYLISYCGAALLALVAGDLTNVLSLAQLAEAHAGLGIVSALLAMPTSWTRLPQAIPIQIGRLSQEPS
jgi:hypothetical protein